MRTFGHCEFKACATSCYVHVHVCNTITGCHCVCYQAAHSDFSQANVDNQSGVTRDQKLKDLAAAYDSFSELRGNLQEGTKVRIIK